MWEVRNATPYQTAGTFMRDADGHEHWCVGIRATFDIRPDGAVVMAARQIPVTLVPDHGPGGTGLVADDDIIPFAPVTDILLRGTASPPAGASGPVPLLLAIGPLAKRAVLHPPRLARLQRGRWRLVEIAPQTPASLGWEAAFGGRLPGAREDEPPENPLGTGIALRAPQLFAEGETQVLPRVEGEGMDCAADPHRSRAVGFGPVPRWWRDRVALAGTFDEAWRRDRAPAMPADHDPRFHCSAPRDQWPDGRLLGGEPVTLGGFGHDGPLQFRLPQAVFRIEAKVGLRLQAMPAHLARVDLWPSDGRLSMLWLGTLRCDARDHLLETSRVTLRQLAGVSR